MEVQASRGATFTRTVPRCAIVAMAVPCCAIVAMAVPCCAIVAKGSPSPSYLPCSSAPIRIKKQQSSSVDLDLLYFLRVQGYPRVTSQRAASRCWASKKKQQVHGVFLLGGEGRVFNLGSAHPSPGAQTCPQG